VTVVSTKWAGEISWSFGDAEGGKHTCWPTLDLACSTLPKFQQALRLLNDIGDYPRTVNVEIRQQLEAAQTYIEIQEAIIRRGR